MPFFFKGSLYFRIILDLQKSYKDHMTSTSLMLYTPILKGSSSLQGYTIETRIALKTQSIWPEYSGVGLIGLTSRIQICFEFSMGQKSLKDPTQNFIPS